MLMPVSAIQWLAKSSGEYLNQSARDHVDDHTDKFPTWNVFCPLPLDTLPLCNSPILKSCLNIWSKS